jgi:hypothetical protein
MLLGNIGTAYGLPPWLGLVIGIALLALLLRAIGTPVENVEA